MKKKRRTITLTPAAERILEAETGVKGHGASQYISALIVENRKRWERALAELEEWDHGAFEKVQDMLRENPDPSPDSKGMAIGAVLAVGTLAMERARGGRELGKRYDAAGACQRCGVVGLHECL